MIPITQRAQKLEPFARYPASQLEQILSEIRENGFQNCDPESVSSVLENVLSVIYAYNGLLKEAERE